MSIYEGEGTNVFAYFSKLLARISAAFYGFRTT